MLPVRVPEDGNNSAKGVKLHLRIEKMRNLKNVLYENWEPPAQFRGRLLTASTWDLSNDSVLCTFGPTETDALIELVRITTKSTSQYASSQI